MGLPWCDVVRKAERAILRRQYQEWVMAMGLPGWGRFGRRATADNREFTASLPDRGYPCSADSGTGLLDGTRLPTF
jgi:hypothetical protein